MTTNLIEVIIILIQLAHNDTRGAGKNGNSWKNSTKDRKRNKFIVKVTLKAFIIIILELFFLNQ